MRSATAPVLYVKGDLMEQSKAGTKAGRRSRSSVRRKKRADYYDYSLVAVIILLICFGLIMLYSTSSYIAQMNYNDDMFYFKKQALISVGCIVMAIGISMLDYHLLIKLTMPLYGAAIVLMGLVKTSLGHESHGAKRWIQIGSLPQFQPAEVVKIGVILMTAYMLSKCGVHALRNVRICYQIYAPAIIGGVLIVGITSNLSSAIIIFGIGAIMIIIAGADKKFALSLVALGGLFLVVILIAGAAMGKGFRFSRIMVWLNPEEYADSGGYQVMQGLYAIGSGGLFGKGLGNSAQKLGFVPEATNDMIFSIIWEELGIFGAICIILLFIFMIRRMRVVACNAPNLFGSMIVIGVMAQISMQVVLNIAVVTNSMPNTGVSLPFISYGGTSLVFLMAEMGLVFSVSKSVKKIR